MLQMGRARPPRGVVPLPEWERSGPNTKVSRTLALLCPDPPPFLGTLLSHTLPGTQGDAQGDALGHRSRDGTEVRL